MVYHRKLPFGPTAPNPYRDVKYLIDVDENVYEAQARLLDNERNYSASCLDVAYRRAGRSYDKGEISREERDRIQDELDVMRERVVRAHTGEDYESLVGKMKGLRTDIMEMALRKG